MKVIASAGREDVALVYIGEFESGKMVEFVEALSPPKPRRDKWVLLVSTMFGCLVGCKMCDAGGHYQGKLSAEEIFAQLDALVYRRYPDGRIPARQFKIQFARMGEPALNPALLTVFEQLPARYHAPGLMPSISTIAPRGAERFFERLLEIKQRFYAKGNFQFQFSLHTSDQRLRDEIIPVRKWNFQQIADYGERFYQPGDRKITLNFALAQGAPLEPEVLLRYFSPERFLIKITPINPTYRADENRLQTYIDPHADPGEDTLVQRMEQAGYRVIVSIGEVEENYIGSNCGQFLRQHLNAQRQIRDGYTYTVNAVAE